MPDFLWPKYLQEKTASATCAEPSEMCCPPSLCSLVESASEEYRVALVRGVLVWIIGATAWAISESLRNLQLATPSLSINDLITLFVTLTAAFILGVIAYGVLSIPVEPPKEQEGNEGHRKGSFAIVQLGLIVGASLGLPAFASLLLSVLSKAAILNTLALAIVVGVIGILVYTAQKINCAPCLCRIQCLPAVAYASAAIAIGYSLNIFRTFEFAISQVYATPGRPLILLTGIFLLLAAGTLAVLAFACVEKVCVPLAIAFSVISVTRALVAVVISVATVVDGSDVTPLTPILVPLVLLCGFWTLWSLLKCRSPVVTVQGIAGALSASIVPAVLVFALPLVREPFGLVAYAAVAAIFALVAVILLTSCIYCSEDCIALILMVASIGVYCYGIVGASTTYYQAFLVVAGLQGFVVNGYAITTTAAIYLAVGIVLLTLFAILGWPRQCFISRTDAARSLVFSAVGAGPAVLFASFAAFYNLEQELPTTELIKALLAWLPIAGSAIVLARSCCPAEVFGGIGVAFGSVAFAKAFGLYSVYGAEADSQAFPIASAIPAWLVILPILVAVGLAIISGFLAKARCGLCPRDTLAVFATGLTIVPLSNIYEAISLGVFSFPLADAPAMFIGLGNVMPVYIIVAYLAALLGLFFLAAPLISCKESPVNCCDLLAGSPAFFAPAFLRGVLVVAIYAAFQIASQSVIAPVNTAAILLNQWPVLASALLFSGLVLGVLAPIFIRLYSGKILPCRLPAFKCTWPKDIITLAIAAIFAGPLVFEEVVRLDLANEGLVWNIVTRLFFLFPNSSPPTAFDPIAVLATVFFAWLVAPLVLNAFLVFVDSAEKVAAAFFITAKSIGDGSIEQLALAVASALALFALVYWQFGSEYFFGVLLKVQAFTAITVFGWYLVLLALLALIVASAVLLRFGSSSPYSRKVIEMVKQWTR